MPHLTRAIPRACDEDVGVLRIESNATQLNSLHLRAKEAKDSVPVALFRTKGEINDLDCDQFAVECDVLHLRAVFLTEEASQGAGAHK